MFPNNDNLNREILLHQKELKSNLVTPKFHNDSSSAYNRSVVCNNALFCGIFKTSLPILYVLHGIGLVVCIDRDRKTFTENTKKNLF